VLLAAALQLLGQLAVLFRVEVLEGEVFQLAAQAAHAEAVRDGREDVEGLLRDAATLFGLEVLERAHVVEAVGEFHQHDAHVVHHRQKHLADVLGLLLLARLVADLRQLREAVHEMRDLFAEGVADHVQLDERVLDHVVQKARCDRDLVESHVGENVGDFERVDEVRLA
jgi:MoxR-like ATPase